MELPALCAAILAALIGLAAGIGPSTILRPVRASFAACSEIGTHNFLEATAPLLLHRSSDHSPPIPRQHTLDHSDCPACTALEKDMDESSWHALTFDEVAPLWLDTKLMFIQPRTVYDYKQYIKSLSGFLGLTKLEDIKIGTVRGYQKFRRDGAGNSRINHELSCLSQIMTEAHLWHLVGPYYKPLPVSSEGPGIALTDEQARHLFAVARKNKRWQVALWASILSVNTTAGPGEIRGLQLQDVDIPNAEIRIRRHAKNKYRVRTIPLNDAALRAIRFLLERASEKGCENPQDYLLPHRASKAGQGFDPSRHQSHWNKAWDKMRKAAGFPKLRQYDLRHTTITALLANPDVPERVVVELAGHVSNRMLSRYSHQRKAEKRAAVDALGGLSKGPESVGLEVVENRRRS